MIFPLRLLPEAAVTVARTYGARGAALRATHEVRRAVGAFRARPRCTLAPGPAPQPHPFAISAARLTAATDRDTALERAARVEAGAHQAYRNEWRLLPDNAGAWTGSQAQDALAPWWTVRHLDPAAGDIKDAWEPARFAWAYDLVRAYVITGDDRYARVFHDHFARWCEGNPPFRGVHWACGQETAIRAVALLYAGANLAAAPSSDGAAMQRVADVLAASGERIADAIGYALSQRNNHAISEAVGLLALGQRFEGSHPEAARWRRNGRRLLERLIAEQFAEDGWYIQHSFTYMRLALDQCVVAQRVLRAGGESLSGGAVARLRAAARLLVGVMDPDTGIVPNHGPNDGAFVHPITLAAYRDFRPVLTAACASFGFERPCGVALDGEVLAWLGLPEPPRSSGAPQSVQAGSSGWAAARMGDTFAFVRAGRYTSRPGHLDALHVDVRFGSREVIVDPGTFAYNAPTPWRNGLAAAAVHNGPMLDDAEPGVRGPRFLWLIWPDARIARAELEGDTAVIVAEMPGRVRRTLRIRVGRVTVEDVILARDAKRARIRWLLHPDAEACQVRVEGGARVLEARDGEVPGWYSPHYGERIRSRYIEVERAVTPGLRITTAIVGKSGPA